MNEATDPNQVAPDAARGASRAARLPRRVRFLGAMLMIAALTAVTTGTVAAKPWAGTTITRTSACNYRVSFSWESMGHGSNLTAWVYLIAWEGSNSSLVASHQFTPKTGRTGYVSWDFVSTESFPYRYGGYGYLVSSSGSIIAKSGQASLQQLPGNPESCA